MKFLWPTMLLWLLAVPILVAAYVYLAPAQEKRRDQVPEPRAAEGCHGARRPLAPPCAAGHPAAVAGRHARRHCAADGDGDVALAAADDHPRHRRVAQHGRDRCRPQSDNRRAGCRQVVHRRTSAQRADRHRRIRRVRIARPAPDRRTRTACWRRSTGSSCSAARPPAARSTSRWRRSSPRRASTWLRWRCPVDSPARNGAASVAASSTRNGKAEPTKVAAGAARLLYQRRRDPDERWPKDDGPRSDGRRHGWRPTADFACSPSDSARRRAP